MLFFLVTLFCPIFCPILLLAADSDSADSDSNVLIYTDPVQISSEINAYENIKSGIPIQGSILITHDKNTPIDNNSFKIGNKPLKATFVKTTSMWSGNLVVSIYSFQLDGMKSGTYTLEPIKATVGGKQYEAPPIIITIGQ